MRDFILDTIVRSLLTFSETMLGFITVGQLKRGDIVRYKNATRNTQHTLMYLGNGKIAEAGRGTRFGVIRKSQKYTGKKKIIEVLRVVEG